MTPTWLMFVYLGIASFAPVVVSLRPGRWMPYYYGALLMWWILVSIVAVRRLGREESSRRLTRTVNPYADVVRRPLVEERLIIVARDDVDLHDRLRRGQRGDEVVRVITNRRSADRRRHLQVYIPDRRSGDRRRHDIDSVLLTQGWAEVTLPKS